MSGGRAPREQKRLQARDTAARVHAGEDALRLVQERGPLPCRDLLQVLSRAHRLPTSVVHQAVAGDPRLALSGDVIRLSHGDSPRGRATETVRRPVNELLYALSLIETDEVLLGPSSSREVRIRCDFIRADSVDRIWVTAKASNADIYQRLLKVAGARQPRSRLRMPLRPASETPSTLPCLLVWRVGAPAQAVRTVERVQAAWTDGRAWRQERAACSPGELERRVEGDRTIRRLGSRPRSSFAVSTCDRCGMPLSDPGSVQLGIGPECRRHYSPEVLAATSRRTSQPVRLGSRTPAQWAALVRPWAENREPA